MDMNSEQMFLLWVDSTFRGRKANIFTKGFSDWKVGKIEFLELDILGILSNTDITSKSDTKSYMQPIAAI